MVNGEDEGRENLLSFYVEKNTKLYLPLMLDTKERLPLRELMLELMLGICCPLSFALWRRLFGVFFFFLGISFFKCCLESLDIRSEISLFWPFINMSKTDLIDAFTKGIFFLILLDYYPNMVVRKVDEIIATSSSFSIARFRVISAGGVAEYGLYTGMVITFLFFILC